MKWGIKSLVLIIALLGLSVISTHAESLFMMGASQSYHAEPKGLYSMVRARSIGDLVTILLKEEINIADDMNYDSSRSSNTVDNFTNFLNKMLPGRIFNDKINNFGGSNDVSSKVQNGRQMSVDNSITVQVVQLLPNGNLVVQGKKTLVNANERVDLLVSGVVDPRWIDELGQISSTHVANLQFAFNGKGSTSRGNNEGIINRVIRYLL
ncbi:flagellar basal body L-ring protein FlgH [bacterium]|nr:flagellar basal body L-ring protein FlgH [bacterium]